MLFGDSCRDGTISINEFVELWKTTGLSKPVLRQHFRRRDLGNVGQATAQPAPRLGCKCSPRRPLFLTLFPTGNVGQLSQPQMLEVLRELRAEVKQQKAREKAQAELALAGGLTLPARRADLPDAELPADLPSASPQKSPQKAVAATSTPPPARSFGACMQVLTPAPSLPNSALSFGAHLTLEDHGHSARVGAPLGAPLEQPPREGELMLKKYQEEKVAQRRPQRPSRGTFSINEALRDRQAP